MHMMEQERRTRGEAVEAVWLVRRPHHGRQRCRNGAALLGQVRRVRRQAILRTYTSYRILRPMRCSAFVVARRRPLLGLWSLVSSQATLVVAGCFDPGLEWVPVALGIECEIGANVTLDAGGGGWTGIWSGCGKEGRE